jgi:hypothetical protein
LVVAVAKRKQAPAKKTSTEAIVLNDRAQEGPSFSTDAIVCVSATLYNVRKAVEETAIKRARGKAPVPLSAMKIALLEHDLGWALAHPEKEDDKEDDANNQTS